MTGKTDLPDMYSATDMPKDPVKGPETFETVTLSSSKKMKKVIPKWLENKEKADKA